jgi:hypothetical protein
MAEQNTPYDSDAVGPESLPAPEGLIRPPALSGAPDANLVMFLQAARDGLDLERLKQVKDLYKEMQADAAKRAFLEALAQAKSEFTPIVKTRLVDYQHKDGRGRTSYKYEELADITDVVVPILSKYGITHSFKVDQSQPPKIKVSCILAHANGYEDAPRTLEGVEDTSGQKSPNQAIASTITFMERGTLKQALGLAAGRDDDGRGPDPDQGSITADDIAYVEQLIRDTESDLEKFLDKMGAPSIAELTIPQYKRGVALLNEKKRRAAGAAQ